jgi:hypothetical protein
MAADAGAAGGIGMAAMTTGPEEAGFTSGAAVIPNPLSFGADGAAGRADSDGAVFAGSSRRDKRDPASLAGDAGPTDAPSICSADDGK